MKNIVFVFCSVVLLVSPMFGFAGEHEGRIVIVEIREDSLVHVKMDTDHSFCPRTDHPEGEPEWDFTMRANLPGEEMMVAAILTAYVSGSNVKLIGTGSCSGGLREIIKSIRVN